MKSQQERSFPEKAGPGITREAIFECIKINELEKPNLKKEKI